MCLVWFKSLQTTYTRTVLFDPHNEESKAIGRGMVVEPGPSSPDVS